MVYHGMKKKLPVGIDNFVEIRTSGNDVVRHFIESAGNEKTKNEIEALVAGETVEKEIHEDLTYNHLYDTIDNIWSILFATGYLTQRGITKDGIYQLSIPNREVRNIFTRQIREMFHSLIKSNRERLEEFCIALKSGDAAKTEKLFTMYLYDMIAVRDSSVHKEKRKTSIMVLCWGFCSTRMGGK